jgi:hypothetical protein
MITTQENYLYSYLYLKLVKTPCFSFYLFSSTKSENRGQNRLCPGRGIGNAGSGEVVEKRVGV